jgi:hypothetical protein
MCSHLRVDIVHCRHGHGSRRGVVATLVEVGWYLAERCSMRLVRHAVLFIRVDRNMAGVWLNVEVRSDLSLLAIRGELGAGLRRLKSVTLRVVTGQL